ncbi:uncharacterized protein [Antedon mediterranea]|uniref:uncharacterized protein n=1 Tax=Antedon mediterranea TaxID=105859 RepID=UPI003AF95903
MGRKDLTSLLVYLTILTTICCNVTSSVPLSAPVLKIKLLSDVSSSQRFGEDRSEDGITFKHHSRIITETEHVNNSQNIHVITLEEDNEISTIIVDGNKDLIVVKNDGTCYVNKASNTIQLISKIKNKNPVVLHLVGNQQIPQEYFAVTSEPMIYNLCFDLPIWWATVSTKQTHS